MGFARQAIEMLKYMWRNGPPEIIVEAAQTGDRMNLYSCNAEYEIDGFDSEFSQIHETLDNLPGDKTVVKKGSNHLCDVLMK